MLFKLLLYNNAVASAASNKQQLSTLITNSLCCKSNYYNTSRLVSTRSVGSSSSSSVKPTITPTTTSKAAQFLFSLRNDFLTFFRSSLKTQQFGGKSSGSSAPTPPPNDPKNKIITVLTFLVTYLILREHFKSQAQQDAQIDSPQPFFNKQQQQQQPGGAQQQHQHPRSFNHLSTRQITWNEFVAYLLPNNVIERIVLFRGKNMAFIVTKPDSVVKGRMLPHAFSMQVVDVVQAEEKIRHAEEQLKIDPAKRVPIEIRKAEPNDYAGLLIFLLVGFLVFRFLTKKVTINFSNPFSSMTKANYTVIDPHLKSNAPKVSFKDVAGLHEAKVEIKEFVDYLKDPEKCQRLGAKVPKGALLLGPPGCGKTLLAKAVASESNVPFFSMAGTEFIEIIGGVGAARVRDLFDEAKKQAPCIIYIDEIDAIGRKRSGEDARWASGESDQTLNQLLVSMDGLESNSNVVVLASTNRADILDKALIRPGRLDRHIYIDLPTYLERIEILNVHMRNLKLAFIGKERDDFVSQLAHLTPRFSGADLANVCNEAALHAARDALPSIDKKSFLMALDRIIGGAEKKNQTMSPLDKKMLAYHECGHVIVSWLHQHCDLILKVSLLSRTKAVAFSQYLPQDRKLYSQEELFDQMCLHIGGRVAESIVFNRFTTNSENDLRKVTNLAYLQVETYGMNEVVGTVSFPSRAEEKAQAGSTGMIGKRPYSRKLSNTIDMEVSKLVSQAFLRTHKTLNENVDMLHTIAEQLLKRENLTYDEIVALIGPPKYEKNTARTKIENIENV